MLCPREGANCCYIDNVKLLQDLLKKSNQSNQSTYGSGLSYRD